MAMTEEELNIQLKILQKVDPCVISIEAHCSQVALYKYMSGNGPWEKTETEGTLFVYQREAEPQYGFTIMNRLNMDNMVEPVTTELDLKIQTPFLLYRNQAGGIFGIWFYKKSECERAGQMIQLMVKEVEKKLAGKKSKSVGKSGDLNQLFKSAEVKEKSPEKLEAPSNDSGKNLLRLLSQNEQPGNNGLDGGGDKSEKTTASVKDFFAMASSNDIQSSSPQMGSTGQSAFTSVPLLSAPPHPMQITALPISQGLAMGAVPVAGYPIYSAQHHIVPPPTTTMNPLVQRMMSNPGIHSVESIEAEQRRSTSPSNVRTSSPPELMTPNTKKLTDLESQLKQKLHIGSRNTFAPVESPSKPAEMNGAKTQQTRQPPSLHTPLSTQPTLLSPQVFTSVVARSSSPTNTNGHNGGGFPPRATITPLTQDQMVEAMSFLLESDPDFVQKLHEAYVKSLSRKFQIMK